MILGIETSGEVGSVSLGRFGEGDCSNAVREIAFPEGTRHGDALASSVDRLFFEEGLSPTEVDVVAVDVGPGSFTGLRVGLAFAKTAAYLLKADLAAVISSDVIAHRVPSKAAPSGLAVALDAARKEVYLALYEATPDGMKRRGEIELLGGKKAVERLKEAGISTVTGNGAALLKNEDERFTVLEEYALPRAAAVAVLGAFGEKADPFTLEPLYMRLPDAEEKWLRRHATGSE